LALTLSTQVAHAQSIEICRTSGSGSSCTGYATIQDAVDAAESNDVITLSAGTFTEGGITIAGKNLTIRGALPRTTIVQAAVIPCGVNAKRVFTIDGSQVSLQNMTIRNGCVRNREDQPKGGGIYSAGKLTLQDVIVRNNEVVYDKQVAITETVALTLTPRGGGVYSVGALTVIDSSIVFNTVRSSGDAAAGGGIYNNGDAYVSNSTFSQNQVFGRGKLESEQSYGGGIYSAGSLNMRYTTVAYNGATKDGGGLYTEGKTTLVGNLITGNSSLGVGAICEEDSPPEDCTELPIGGIDLGDLTSDTLTPVHIPGANSPTLDKIFCSLLEGPSQDQRRSPRLVGSKCDLGSVERGIAFVPFIQATPPGPDLIVESVKIDPPGPLNAGTDVLVTVEIKNIGDKPTMGTFYIDLFVNPRETPPNNGGTSWYQLCRNDGCNNERGIQWRVTGTVAENQVISFTSKIGADEFIVQPTTRWDRRFAAGEVQMWVIVDSYEENRSEIGRIAERWERNNRYTVPKFIVAPTAVTGAAADTSLSELPPLGPDTAP
jgi:predicted outer membrane repeat protein